MDECDRRRPLRARPADVAASRPARSTTDLGVPWARRSAGMLLVCVFLYVGAVLAWKGWDIDLDSKTFKFSIKRFGTGR
jgi:hypothetical protein